MKRGVVAGLLAATLLTGACTRNASDARPTISAGVPPAVRVAAVDFPSFWLAERVGGQAATVERIDVAEVSTTDADLIAYVRGLDPAVDTAVAALPPEQVVDTLDDVGLIDRPDQPGSKDPYVWFDPVNVGLMAGTVGNAMAKASATQFEAYQYYGLRALQVQGEALEVDQRLQEQLNPCRIATVVAQEPIFTYLARAYGLKQVPLSQWRPERPPVPALYFTQAGQAAVTDAAAAVSARPVAVESFTQSAPEDDLLQGVLDTGEVLAAHQDCPLVTPESSARPR